MRRCVADRQPTLVVLFVDGVEGALLENLLLRGLHKVLLN